MNLEENDPDTLQLLDELNPDWVKFWTKATKEKKPTGIELKIYVTLPKIETQRIVKASI